MTAELIDIGNLSLQNIATANFNAPNGDIRGDGTLDIAGHITMNAGQIYPVTGTVFTIAAYDKSVLVAASSAGSKTVTLFSSTLPPGFGIGSPLLGSTVQSISGTTVTLAANANATISNAHAGSFTQWAPERSRSPLQAVAACRSPRAEL